MLPVKRAEPTVMQKCINRCSKLQMGSIKFGQEQYAVLLWSLVVNCGLTLPKKHGRFSNMEPFRMIIFLFD